MNMMIMFVVMMLHTRTDRMYETYKPCTKGFFAHA